MNPLTAVVYSFLLGILHGILPDEHTWPITFSYAIGSGSKHGMKAGLYFSMAFTIQRMLISELSYLALAPILLKPEVNDYVYIAVGIVMVFTGFIVIKRRRYSHIHLIGHHHNDVRNMEKSSHLLSTNCETCDPEESDLPVKWTLIHGFIAGFGFGSFALFVNTIAAPAMHDAWTAFLPGLMFGVGTMLMLILIGFLFGVSLKLAHALTEDQIKAIGSETGGRSLFFGGGLFALIGIGNFMGLEKILPFDESYATIAAFTFLVVVPAFIYSYRKVVRAKDALTA